jgi:hypothetical protein
VATRKEEMRVESELRSLPNVETGDLIKYWKGDRGEWIYAYVVSTPRGALKLSRFPTSRLTEFHAANDAEFRRNPKGANIRAAKLLGLDKDPTPFTLGKKQIKDGYSFRSVISQKSGREARAQQAKAQLEQQANLLSRSAMSRVRGEIDAKTLLKRIESLPAGYVFKVKAKTDTGREHDVMVKLSDYKVAEFKGKRIISVEGTPGSWYAHSLLDQGTVPRAVSIQYSQNWTWVNPREVFAAFILDGPGRSSGKSAARKPKAQAKPKPKPQAKTMPKRKAKKPVKGPAKASSRKLTEDEAEVMYSLESAIADDPHTEGAGRQYFVGDEGYPSAFSLARAKYANVTDSGDDWVFIEATNAGLGKLDLHRGIEAMELKLKVAKAKAAKPKAKGAANKPAGFKLTPRRRTVLAVASNAYADGSDATYFWGADLKPARDAAKAGLAEETGRDKMAGKTIVYFRLTPKGAKFARAHGLGALGLR